MKTITIDINLYRLHAPLIQDRASEIHIVGELVTVTAPNGNMLELEEALSWAP